MTLGDAIGVLRNASECGLVPARISELMDLVELRQHARDRVAEREDIEFGWLDLGEAGA